MSGVELTQLQFDAFTDRARADAGRIHRLHVPEDALHFGGRRHDFRLQIARNLLERLDDIAVVVDRVDDRGADAHFALVQAGHLELPGQVLLQRFAARVREVLRLIVAAGPRRLGRARDLRVAPVRIVDQVDVGSGLFAIGARRSNRSTLRSRGGFELRLDDIAAFEDCPLRLRARA